MARFDEALRALARSGAELRDVALPHSAARGGHLLPGGHGRGLEQPRPLRRRPLRPARERPGDLAAMYGRTRDAGFGPEVKRRIILGTFALSAGYYDAYYVRAQKVRTLIRRDFERAFERCDVIATPTTPTPAFRLGEKTDDPAADVPRGHLHRAREPRRDARACRCRAGSPRACRWGCSCSAGRSTRRRCCASAPASSATRRTTSGGRSLKGRLSGRPAAARRPAPGGPACAPAPAQQHEGHDRHAGPSTRLPTTKGSTSGRKPASSDT